jgi:glutamine amidotransferase PdxT
MVAESTTIALLARLSGLLEPLKQFIETKPVWGTCAGAILLSRSVTGAKKDGQELLGGVSVDIARNGWGSQVGVAKYFAFFLKKSQRQHVAGRVFRSGSGHQGSSRPIYTLHWHLHPRPRQSLRNTSL